jgi:ferredoxin-NADP reductase
MEEMTDLSGVDFVANPSGSNAMAETIRQVASEVDPKQIQISFCGPKGLLERLRDLMKENGIPTKNIHYEFFDFR